MPVTIGVGQKVTAQLTPIDKDGNPLPANSVSGLTAQLTNPLIDTVGNVDQVANTVVINGIGPGDSNIVYSAFNAANKQVSTVDQITVVTLPELEESVLSIVE